MPPKKKSTTIPDVFDDESSVVTEDVLPSPQLPPMPAEPISSTFTVPQQGENVEHKLPSFLINQEELAIPPIEAAQEKVLESVMPQAFVGEVREVAQEARKEKKGMFVTFFIIIGMVFVALGVAGLYFVSTKKSTQVVEQIPTPIVEATPAPTPTVVVNVASNSAQLATGSANLKLKINVLNGTTVKGLAAKEAAVLKKAGFVIGTVGNGDPTLAGKISVPKGSSTLGESIKAALPDFTFTVTESATAKEVTVTLGKAAQ